MKTLEKIKAFVKPLRKDDMIRLSGGTTLTFTNVTSTSWKGGTTKADYEDSRFD